MKILIYSYNDKLGDGLQKISFIQEIKKRFPNSIITYTTSEKTTLKNILKPLVNEYINEIIEHNGVRSSFTDLLKNNQIFQNRYFDLIIDLQKVVLRTLNLKKIPHKRFFSTTANFLFSDFKNNRNMKFKNIYIERFYLNIISLIINQKLENIENFEIPIYKVPILDNKNGRKRIGIAPGAGNIIREWGFKNYMEIAKYLKTHGYDVYFFLGPNESKYLQSCKLNNFKCPEWENGKMISNNILFIFNLAKQIDCLLCNDGGTSWIFEFTGIPTFKIFGVTNERKFARPKYSTTLQVKDYGFNTLQKFPVKLYKTYLLKFLQKRNI